MALIETMILQIVANVLAKQDILMMEMKFVLSAIILGLFFYLKKIFKSLECEGPLITDCTSCDTTNTHRDDNHGFGECPCSLGYTDAGALVCTPLISCHHSWYY